MRGIALSLCLLASPAFSQTSDGHTKILERDLAEMRELIPGFYTNEEQVYFQDNLELDTDVPRIEISVIPEGNGFKASSRSPRGERVATLNYFVRDGAIRSRETREGEPDCERVFRRHFGTYVGEGCGGTVTIAPDGLSYGSPDRMIALDRADPFTCWVAPQKRDGEYAFRNDIVLHDGGGRQWVEGEDFETVGLRMRHVRWPSGNNRDSLVLYVHKGDDAEWTRAESYAWTEPVADRIAVNLRWVQVSCTRGGELVTPGIDLKTGSGN